jgi:23S rRNA pseudouridine1911/1915/1917 synthase
MRSMPGERVIIVDPAASGERLDRFLRSWLPDLSRAALRDLIQSGRVRVNGRGANKGSLLQPGDRIETRPPLEASGPARDAQRALAIVYEDPWLVVVNKPAGVPSHALRADEQGAIATLLLARYPEMAEVGYRALEPGLLHRLDTDTSGILIAARDRDTFERLRAAHVAGEFDKRYLALCSGALAPQRVTAYLRADQRRVRVETVPVACARAITTEILSAIPHGDFSLVSVRVPHAARHQVRAQLAALGHPIAGDALYGGAPLPGLAHHFLHASEVTLQHPHEPRALQLTAPLPAELVAVLDGLLL